MQISVGHVAQWIRYLTSNQMIAGGSSPVVVIVETFAGGKASTT